MDNVFQLQPNTFTMDMNTLLPPTNISTQPPEMSPPAVELNVEPPKLRVSPQNGTLTKSVSSSLTSTLRSVPGGLTQASQQQLFTNEGGIGTGELWQINDTIRESVLGDRTDYTLSQDKSSKTSIYQSMDSRNSYQDVTDVSQITQESLASPVVDNHTEIKRLGNVVVEAPKHEEMKDVYISKCTAIIRRDVALDQTNQGLRLVPRVRNEYIENLRFV